MSINNDGILDRFCSDVCLLSLLLSLTNELVSVFENNDEDESDRLIVLSLVANSESSLFKLLS